MTISHTHGSVSDRIAQLVRCFSRLRLSIFSPSERVLRNLRTPTSSKAHFFRRNSTKCGVSSTRYRRHEYCGTWIQKMRLPGRAGVRSAAAQDLRSPSPAAALKPPPPAPPPSPRPHLRQNFAVNAAEAQVPPPQPPPPLTLLVEHGSLHSCPSVAQPLHLQPPLHTHTHPTRARPRRAPPPASLDGAHPHAA